MKNMQDFYNRLTSNKNTSFNHKSRLVALMRLRRSTLRAATAFEPWYVWSAESSPEPAE